MNWVDLIIIIFLLSFTLVGYWRGFIRQSMDLIVFIVAILLSFTLYRHLGGFLANKFPIASSFANATGFFIVWFVVEFVYYTFFIIFYDKIPERIVNSKFNKYFGLLPAMIRGVLFIWIMLSLILILPLPVYAKKQITGSVIGGPIVKTSPIIEGYIEKIFGSAINDTITFLTVKPQSNESIDLGFKVDSPQVDAQSEEKMLVLLNIERKNHNLKPLTMDEKLRKVARAHSTDMFKRGYFAHNTPEGLTPFNRMDSAGIEYLQAGENLALAPDVEIAHNGLMNSPGHRANILTAEFNKVGLGCMDGGMYGKMFSQEFTN
ncbi:MAG: CvpA family protein [bacterium]